MPSVSASGVCWTTSSSPRSGPLPPPSPSVPRMQRVLDSVGRYAPRITPRTVLSSPLFNRVDAPNRLISELNTSPAYPRANASPPPCGKPTHDSGPWRLATPYHVVDFHHLLHAGFCRRFLNTYPVSRVAKRAAAATRAWRRGVRRLRGRQARTALPGRGTVRPGGGARGHPAPGGTGAANAVADQAQLAGGAVPRAAIRPQVGSRLAACVSIKSLPS